MTQGRVLVVAGSDSGGGAGIQADIKTVMALGGYAQTAVTALTAQDTHGVRAVVTVEPRFIQLQMRMAFDDIGVDVVKTGMLGDVATIDAVCDVLDERVGRIPVVVDPVMTAKGGTSLLQEAALGRLRARLFGHATLLTPNLPEAEALTGVAIADEAAMHAAIDALLAEGVAGVLLKGGHLPGPEVVDILATRAGRAVFRAPRIDTRHTHGTGCTLASAVATGLAQGMKLDESVARARQFVRTAIAAAPGLGGGHGPLGHQTESKSSFFEKKDQKTSYR